MKSEGRLIAIDPSLTCSGWALFRMGDGVLVGVGKIKSRPPKIALAERLVDLQHKVQGLLESLEVGANDVLVTEAPTTMRDPRAAFLVEQVRCIFEILARTRAVRVPGRINPRSVHHEIMGLRGKQLPRDIIKDTAVETVRHLYSQALVDLGFPVKREELSRHQDVVDAILVGAVALSWIRSASGAKVDMELVFRPSRTRLTSKSYRGIAC